MRAGNCVGLSGGWVGSAFLKRYHTLPFKNSGTTGGQNPLDSPPPLIQNLDENVGFM